MEATNTDAQEVQTTESPTGQVQTEDQPKQFDDMSQEDLIKMVATLQNRVHEVNEESKGRKLKLRALETEKQEREEAILKEKGEYKELYENQMAELEELRPLREFKEKHEQLQANELVELEKKLTATEREELGIFDDLTTDKKIQWIKLKLKNRTSVNLDTSSSVQSGGGLKKLPQNRAEMRNLSTEEKLEFREKYPEQYGRAILK